MTTPTLSKLYRSLHELDARLLETPAWRVGGRWWSRKTAERRCLRLAVDGAVQRRVARRTWAPVP
jgi:hypothetical protein